MYLLSVYSPIYSGFFIAFLRLFFFGLGLPFTEAALAARKKKAEIKTPTE